MLANGENSFNCSEESCNNPFADSIITSENIYNFCSEEVVIMGDRDNKGRFVKGHKPSDEMILKASTKKKGKIPWNKGKTDIFSEEAIRKNSDAHKGKIPWISGKHHTDKSRLKMSNSHIGLQIGIKHPRWKGGNRLRNARMNAKRKEKGFLLINIVNPYDEPIEYHHIHPDLPYVVPCPKRIHQMFIGKNHFENVNAMLGFRLSIGEICN